MQAETVSNRARDAETELKNLAEHEVKHMGELREGKVPEATHPPEDHLEKEESELKKMEGEIGRVEKEAEKQKEVKTEVHT